MQKKGTALITGATGGMGRAFGSALAAKGYDLILTDRDQQQLDKLAKDIENYQEVRVETFAVDLTIRSDLERLGREIVSRGDLEILVNNAGFGNHGPFAESDLQENIDMIDVHVVASVWLCWAAVPGMVTRGKGAIVNISSIAGFRPGPGSAVYGSTKRFLLDFSKSLQGELGAKQVKVQALCAGYTRTGFHSTSNLIALARDVPGWLWMTPDDVVARSLAALENSKVVCIPGFRSHCLRVLLYLPVMTRLIRAVTKRLS